MTLETVPQLIAQCGSGDPEAQTQAIRKLVAARAAEAVPAIAALLGAAEPPVRAHAAHALGVLGAGQVDAVGPALSALLQDPDAFVRSEAVAALGLLAYRPAAQAVAGLLQDDPDELVRAEAAETLGDVGAGEALPGLQAALAGDPDESVRAYAAAAIGLVGNPAVHAWLAECQGEEPSLRVQGEILGARYRLGDAAALPPLLALLGAADEDLATCMLNMLQDVLTRRVPAAIVRDAPALAAALDALSTRLPALQPHVAQFRHQLPRS